MIDLDSCWAWAGLFKAAIVFVFGLFVLGLCFDRPRNPGTNQDDATSVNFERQTAPLRRAGASTRQVRDFPIETASQQKTSRFLAWVRGA